MSNDSLPLVLLGVFDQQTRAFPPTSKDLKTIQLVDWASPTSILDSIDLCLWRLCRLISGFRHG
jgi:hypothetical protein